MADFTRHAPGRPQGRDRPQHYRHPRHPIIRWSCLATGSLVGIGTWALFYVLGATVAVCCGVTPANASFAARLMLGIYGALSASCALGLAAYTAARVSGAQTVENALLYGLSLWSMSTITLVTVATAASSGWVSAASLGASAPIVNVGLAAIGFSPDAVPTGGAGALGAMCCTLVLSLLIALGGALRARRAV